MKILVACEFSGVVRDAFLRLGHDAISCDILPTEVKGPHITGDVLSIDLSQFDMMIAHPPCTHLAVSGARWWPKKQTEQQESIEFVRRLLSAPIDRIALENPIGILSTVVRKPSDHPTMGTWPRRNQSHMPMVEKLAKTNSVQRGIR